jgi:hypothetical protein
MSIHRRNPRRDANEAEIIAALRAAGASVQPLSARGVPDVLVGVDGRNILLEIKVGNGKLTSDEATWHKKWRGQVVVVRSIEEALEAIGRM